MLSKRQISFLRYVSERGSVPRPEVLAKAETFGFDEIDVDTMESAGCLELRHDDAGKPHLAVADKGLAEIEECDRMLRAEKLSEEANAISRKANQISNTANCKSTAAIVVAVIAILVQIISDFGPELWGLVQRLFQGLNNP
mgnify:CR=1 FL=1